jgi:excisionase family DNA binding protein
MKRGWITGLEAIACYMNICRDTLLSWMKKYDMPIVKVGRKWCAVEYQLDEWLNFPYKKRPKKGTSKTPPKIHT